MEGNIIELINNNEKLYSLKEIIKQLKLQNTNYSTIKDELTKLSNEGKIVYHEDTDTYGRLDENYKVVEILCTSKGEFYFIDDFNQKITVMKENLNGAFSFNKVLIQSDNGIYKVKKIISRKHDKLVCEVRMSKDIKYLVPLNVPDHYCVRISSNHMKALADGDRVLVQVIGDNLSNCLEGKLVKLICHRNAPDKELLSIAYSKDFDPEFSLDALKELEEINDYVMDNELEGRLDLRNEDIFTIDGAIS